MKYKKEKNIRIAKLSQGSVEKVSVDGKIMHTSNILPPYRLSRNKNVAEYDPIELLEFENSLALSQNVKITHLKNGLISNKTKIDEVNYGKLANYISDIIWSKILLDIEE